MTAHADNLAKLAALITRMVPEYQCATCGEYFPSNQIKNLCRRERGEWVDVMVCREHEKEWIDQGGWRE